MTKSIFVQKYKFITLAIIISIVNIPLSFAAEQLPLIDENGTKLHLAEKAMMFGQLV